MDKYLAYYEELDKSKREDTYRTLPHLQLRGKWIQLGPKKLLNLNGNDYLGLLNETELKVEYNYKAYHYSPSASSSRLLTGNDSIYDDLESLLSTMYGSESALVWNSGYHANTGIIPVLALPHTLLLADRYVHASIIDGLRLSGQTFRRYRHNDIAHLEQILQQSAGEYERVWVITESLFSMDGDIALLRDIVELKKCYPNLFVYVDEAHAVGVFGEQGLGLVSQMGLLSEVDVLIGTFGKAYASVGAFSIHSQVIKELLISSARSLIYSTALPPVTMGWTYFLLQKVPMMDDRRAYLRSLIEILNQELGTQYESQIIPVVVPGEEGVTARAQQFVDHGYYVRPLRKPTVPASLERLRISLNASMSEYEVRHIAKLIKE